MSITLRWIVQAYRNLAAIVRTFEMSNDDRRDYFRVLVQTIAQHLESHKGRPPESELMPDVTPETRVWEVVTDRIWLVFVVRPIANFWSRLFGSTGIEIIIRDAFNRSPSQEDLGLPPL